MSENNIGFSKENKALLLEKCVGTLDQADNVLQMLKDAGEKYPPTPVDKYGFVDSMAMDDQYYEAVHASEREFYDRLEEWRKKVGDNTVFAVMVMRFLGEDMIFHTWDFPKSQDDMGNHTYISSLMDLLLTDQADVLRCQKNGHYFSPLMDKTCEATYVYLEAGIGTIRAAANGERYRPKYFGI